MTGSSVVDCRELWSSELLRWLKVSEDTHGKDVEFEATYFVERTGEGEGDGDGGLVE